MNFLLKNLELQLAETHLLVGERILEDELVKDLRETERNLWVAQVSPYEIEIQITPSRVKACTCDCPSFGRDKMCAHIAACLLALRKLKSEKKESIEVAIKEPTLHRKLTISSVLSNISHEDLLAFTRQFARSNPSFSLSLKARFAAAVPMRDSREKYVQLLDSVIRSSRKANDRISKNGVKLLTSTAGTLLGQSDDLIALEHYNEAVIILQVLLEKLTPIIRKCDTDSDKLLKIVHHVFDKVESLVGKPMPPLLKLDLWEFCLSEIQRPAYRFNDLFIYFFSLLLGMADSREKASELLELLNQELGKNNLQETYFDALSVCKMKLLYKENFKKEKKELELKAIESPESLLFHLDTALKAGIKEWVKRWAKKGLTIVNDPFDLSWLESILLKLAYEDDDSETILEISKRRFLYTWDIEYFMKCRLACTENWEHHADYLIAQIQKRAPLSKKVTLLAAVYSEDNRPNELISLLEQQASPDLLMEYGLVLLKGDKSLAFGLYEKILSEYLGIHIGVVPARKIQEILGHLRQSGFSSFAGVLFKKLQKKFPDRLAVSEDIESFLAAMEN